MPTFPRKFILLLFPFLVIIACCGPIDNRSAHDSSNLFLPKDGPDSANRYSNFPKTSQLVILLTGNSEIFAYMGGELGKARSYSKMGLTNLLNEKKSDTMLTVLIKPDQKSTYQDLVDVLDLMTITDIKRYALVDLSKDEEDFLKKPRFMPNT